MSRRGSAIALRTLGCMAASLFASAAGYPFVAELAAANAHAPSALLRTRLGGTVTGMTTRARSTPPRSPSGPPLLGAQAVAPGVTESEEPSASAPPSGGDVLAQNGLSSPLCRTPFVLPRTAASSCQTSGFVAAPQPTGNYAFDVNIDTGIGHWSNDASATVQDFAQLGWVALVAITHALVVMFEWSYSLNLLGGDAMGQATHALHRAGLTFTDPWMALALSIASALTAYHGLVRRRVAQSVGEALSGLAMIAAALWVIANPVGTIGALARLADEAAIGTLAATADGTGEPPQATLAVSTSGLFGAAVTAPWCYLEFGNVGWCENPQRLDPRLRQAALAIAARLRSSCQSACVGRTESQALAARLLGEARTNGQLFLALPANELERNSTKARGTLLNVLCGGGEGADKCRGPTAEQAEFRSERGTDSRIMGLLTIWLGALGMLLLFGSLAVRLLVAGAAALLYLLLAPAVALAPALGESGRSVFSAWFARLLVACVSKLTYSLLLGVLLSVTHVLLGLTALGWWAQWCLVSAFWWTAFAKRRRALSLLGGTNAPWRSTPVRVFDRHASGDVALSRFARAGGRLPAWAGLALRTPPSLSRSDPHRHAPHAGMTARRLPE
jgi:hypothetical protein